MARNSNSLSTKYTININGVNTTIWQENEKIKQSGNPEMPEYIAEFKNNKEAKTYILGMICMAEFTSSLINEQSYL